MEKKFVSVVLYLHNQENNIKNFFDSSYKTIKENFENVYTNYHSLGLNGVMDGIRKSFMELPTEAPEKE